MFYSKAMQNSPNQNRYDMKHGCEKIGINKISAFSHECDPQSINRTEKALD